jgi:peptidoglycan/LPS O-acetylase OafA/YrhL
MSQRCRIASLDGLRAVSIGLVLFGHLAGTRGFPVPSTAARWFELSEIGVRVFFVISGFLITGLLLREIETAGHIDLLRFYYRRTFRIFPPYYVFLAAMFALGGLGLLHFAPGDLLHAVTYTSNYHPTRSWNVGHAWSLAVEEQFYLLWPALLVVLGRRRGLVLAAAFVALSPVIRLGAFALVPSIRPGMEHRFEMAADAIAMGCLLAGLEGWLDRRPLYRRLLASRLFLLVPALVIAITALLEHPRLAHVLGTVMNAGVALCIHRSVLHATGGLGRLLNSRPLVWMGVMSYSIYLWQQIFLNRSSAAPLCAFPLNLALVFGVAALSYWLIERPALRWRARLESRLFAPPRRRAPAVARGGPAARPGRSLPVVRPSLADTMAHSESTEVPTPTRV